MKLLTKRQREKLLDNGRNRDQDHLPVVKFFDPSGAATWLFTELHPEDGDTLFGLADLGCGMPELGYFSLAEIASVRGPFGLGIERDLYFEAKYPLSVYAVAARAEGKIVEMESELEVVANHCDCVLDSCGRYAPGSQQCASAEITLMSFVRSQSHYPNHPTSALRSTTRE